jgi:hypothetical protein
MNAADPLAGGTAGSSDARGAVANEACLLSSPAASKKVRSALLPLVTCPSRSQCTLPTSLI